MNHEVRLVDAVARKWSKQRSLEDVLQFDPEMLVVDTNFSSMVSDVEFAEEAKMSSNGRIKTTIVGPSMAVFGDDVLRRYDVDFVARKEFDFTLPEIAEALEREKSLRGIKGISYKEEGTVVHNPDRSFITSEELDRLPFVSQVYHKHLNVKDYWLDHTAYPMVQIITSRGCPHLCTFCSWPENLLGREFRARSAVNIADEVEWILDNMPEVKEIFFEDDSFTIDTRRVHEFVGEVKRRRLNFTWSCQTRATLDYATMREMKEAGCRLLDVGFESGSDVILRCTKKGLTVSRTRRFANDARRAGLLVLADFVFGFPGETKETIQETKRYIKEIRPSLLQIAIAIPIPGTEFFRWSRENGCLLEEDPRNSIDDRGFQKCLISYPTLSQYDLQKAVKDALMEYYISPTYIPVAIRNFIVGRGFHELKSMIVSATGFLGYVGSP
jgi:radical SAM superfamily enzyme YgiQ (UPF0313 family)